MIFTRKPLHTSVQSNSFIHYSTVRVLVSCKISMKSLEAPRIFWISRKLLEVLSPTQRMMSLAKVTGWHFADPHFLHITLSFHAVHNEIGEWQYLISIFRNIDPSTRSAWVLVSKGTFIQSLQTARCIPSNGSVLSNLKGLQWRQ